MTPSTLLQRARVALQKLQKLAEGFPLAAAKLWHTVRSSQRSAVAAALGPGLLLGILLGGNRSGKTEAGAQLAVAFALGRDHPAVQLWALRNGLDVSRIQLGPGMVCCSALTSNDSIRVQREKIASYLPPGPRWSNRTGHGEAVARLPSGGSLLFKSNDQRARSYQGADWHFLWMDEEHDEAVFNEARMRLADHAGLAVFSMTPLKGRTWVWRRFVDTPNDDYEGDCAVYALDSRDNPYVPQWYLDKLLSKYGRHERAARERGEFTVLEGRVYDDFSRAVHVVPAFDPPAHWPRFQGWDFGVRNPTAVLWFALDEVDDVLHQYREHYKSGWTTKQHAEHVLVIEQCASCEGEPAREDGDPFVDEHRDRFDRVTDSRDRYALRHQRVTGWACRNCSAHPGRSEPEPDWRVADPAAAGDRKTLSRHHGIRTIPARNEVRPGINDVAERIALDAVGRPHLVVHDCCPHTISEYESYVWKPSAAKSDDPDMPLKRNDHAMDVSRYVCRRLSRAGSFGATA